jgi:hypothetical protein
MASFPGRTQSTLHISKKHPLNFHELITEVQNRVSYLNSPHNINFTTSTPSKYNLSNNLKFIALFSFFFYYNDFWREYHYSNHFILNSTLHHSRVCLRSLFHNIQHSPSCSLWLHWQKPSSCGNLQGSDNNIPCILDLHNLCFLRCN